MDRRGLRRRAGRASCRSGKAPDEWAYGDLEAGFKNAALVLDETFVAPTHEPPAARNAHGDGLLAERQAVHALLDAEHACRRCGRRALGRHRSRRTSSSSASTRAAASAARTPGAIVDGDSGAAVEEGERAGDDAHHPRGGALHRPRAPGHALAREGGLRARTAASPPSTCSSSSTTVRTSRWATSARPADHVSLLYQPTAMRWRGVDGADQHAAARRAARTRAACRATASWSRCSRRRRASSASTRWRSTGSTRRRARRRSAGRTRAASGRTSTSAFVKEALDKGAELFNWDERKARSGKRSGTKVRGVGVARQRLLGRLDRLRRPARHQAGRPHVRPVGHRQPRHRVGASTCTASPPKCSACRGRQCDVDLGQHRQEPAVDAASRRQPDDARDDARGARGGARTRCESCRRSPRRTSAASPRTTRVANERVSSGSPARSLTLAQAAQKAIELGGTYDGHELPTDINAFTKDLGDGAGRPGADGRGEGQLPARRRHRIRSWPASPKSKWTSRPASTHLLDFLAVADVGTVIHPRSLARPDARRLHARHRATRSRRSGSTTSTTACRWRSASTRTSRRRFSTCRPR